MLLPMPQVNRCLCNLHACIAGGRCFEVVASPTPAGREPNANGEGERKFNAFLAAVPWEEPAPEMLAEVMQLLKQNYVTRVTHFAGLDAKNLRFDECSSGGTLAFIKKAVDYYELQYGSDDESDKKRPRVDAKVAQPRTPIAEAGGERVSLLEEALMGTLGKHRKVYEQVDMDKLMEKSGLDWYFPAEVRACA
jgi:hypothetical protein